MSGDPNRRRRRRSALLFGLTLLVPVVSLAAIEAGLRGIGFGSGYPLFVDAVGMPGYREANPDVIWRYYDRAPALAIDPMPFRAERQPGSTRIVVQGGSTAAGFPFGRWASLAALLGDRLAAALPHREIEVVSTAMAAVGSNTLRDLVEEIVAVEPDAVLIYAGHNEYLGILGAASAMAPARAPVLTRAYLALRRLRLYQLTRALLATLRGALPVGDGEAPERSSVMAEAAAGALVPLDSPLYERGLDQYTRNLEAMLVRYREAGIPVFVGTLVSNEKDQPPFASASGADVDRELVEALWQQARQHRAAGAAEEARAVLQALVAADAGSADAWFALGQLEREAGDLAAARSAFLAAKDRDQLRFRAPESFNERIRALAARHGATVVEVQQHLLDATPDGIVGDELMLEHLHPNADGYFLLADAYYEALRSAGAVAALEGAPSRALARRDMPLTAIDRIRAQRIVAELENDFPFVDERREVQFPEPTGVAERLADQLERGEIEWLDAMDALLQHYLRTQRRAEARVVARVAAESYPTAAAPNFVAGRLYLDAGEYRRARRYLARSLAANPDDPATLRALIRAERGAGDAEAAAELRSRLGIRPAGPSGAAVAQ